MNVEVITRSEERRAFLEKLVRFYIRELKLTKSKYNVTVVPKRGSAKNLGFSGCVMQLDNDHREMVIFIDSGLNVERTMKTLAHEMIHVKQIARGQLQEHVTKNGNLQHIWMGKVNRQSYYKRPWEIEAYSRENELAHRVVEFVTKKQQQTKKSRKRLTKTKKR